MGYCKADAFKLSEKEQVKLAQSTKIMERRHLAKRQDICKKATKILAKDPDEAVRFNLARCTKHDDICRELAKKDDSRRVRNVAAQRMRHFIK